MGRRRGRMWQCCCGKIAYSNWRLARRVLIHLDGEGSVYFCRRGGAYHISQRSQLDYDRRASQLKAGRVATA